MIRLAVMETKETQTLLEPIDGEWFLTMLIMILINKILPLH